MDIIEKLEDRAVSYEQSGPSAHHTAALLREAKHEIGRLREALESLTEDPPATLDEPDQDWEVIIKMRNIAREALGLPHGPMFSNGHHNTPGE